MTGYRRLTRFGHPKCTPDLRNVRVATGWVALSAGGRDARNDRGIL